MNKKLKQKLARVVWLGGATDSGKSTIAQKFAERHDYYVYHYDEHDLGHHKLLAETNPVYQKALKATLSERWVESTPEELLPRFLKTARDRFPLVIEDLLSMPADKIIIAEGFGLLPNLLNPLISNINQALWLIPTKKFMQESFARRGKPSFAAKTSDPEKAKLNLFARDMALVKYYRHQAPLFGYKLFEVNVSHSIDDMTNLAEAHFSDYISLLKGVNKARQL
ncbi:MAG: hypothetical protein GY803_26995 [Chloroflexi bacterium]|nr:hypothetical protein [Chloroflexota bacterium]